MVVQEQQLQRYRTVMAASIRSFPDLLSVQSCMNLVATQTRTTDHRRARRSTLGAGARRIVFPFLAQLLDQARQKAHDIIYLLFNNSS